MRSFFSVAHHAEKQVQSFCLYSCKNLAPESHKNSMKASAFNAFCGIQYALFDQTEWMKI